MRKKSMNGNDEVMTVELLEEGRYYTYREVAGIVRCSERTLYSRVKNGEIKPLRNGRRVLFTKACIEEFLQRESKTPIKQMSLQPLELPAETGNPLVWCLPTPYYIGDPVPALKCNDQC